LHVIYFSFYNEIDILFKTYYEQLFQYGNEQQYV